MLKGDRLSGVLSVEGHNLEVLVPSEHEEVTTGRPDRLASFLVIGILADVLSGLSSTLLVHFDSDRAITSQINDLNVVFVASTEEVVSRRTEVDAHALVSSVDLLDHLEASGVKETNFTVPPEGHVSAVRREI